MPDWAVLYLSSWIETELGRYKIGCLPKRRTWFTRRKAQDRCIKSHVKLVCQIFRIRV